MNPNATKRVRERLARLEADAVIEAGIPGQLTPHLPHAHWVAYPGTEVLFNCAQAVLEAHVFPSAILLAAGLDAHKAGHEEATVWLLIHGPAGNIFPDCDDNSYFSNLEKSAQLMSGSANTAMQANGLRGVLAQIGEMYRTGWTDRFVEEAT